MMTASTSEGKLSATEERHRCCAAEAAAAVWRAAGGCLSSAGDAPRGIEASAKR